MYTCILNQYNWNRSYIFKHITRLIERFTSYQNIYINIYTYGGGGVVADF